jgi:hypothetical protein
MRRIWKPRAEASAQSALDGVTFDPNITLWRLQTVRDRPFHGVMG